MDHVIGRVADEQRILDTDFLDGPQSSNHLGGLDPLLGGEGNPQHLRLESPEGSVDLEPGQFHRRRHLIQTQQRLGTPATAVEMQFAVFDLWVQAVPLSDDFIESSFQCRQRVLADANDRDAEQKGASHNGRHRQAKTGCDKGYHQKQGLHEDLLCAGFLGTSIVVECRGLKVERQRSSTRQG